VLANNYTDCTLQAAGTDRRSPLCI